MADASDGGPRPDAYVRMLQFLLVKGPMASVGFGEDGWLEGRVGPAALLGYYRVHA